MTQNYALVYVKLRTRPVDWTTLTGNPVYPSLYDANRFQLTGGTFSPDSSQVGPYLTMHDSYMIRGVRLEFQLAPRFIAAAAGTATASTFPDNVPLVPRCYFWIDDEDNDMPDPIALPWSGVPKVAFLDPNVGKTSCKLYFRPKWLTQTYESLSTTGYHPSRGWISCNDPTVPHYGLKKCWELSNASEWTSWCPAWNPEADQYHARLLVRCTYYLAFKGKRLGGG